MRMSSEQLLEKFPLPKHPLPQAPELKLPRRRDVQTLPYFQLTVETIDRDKSTDQVAEMLATRLEKALLGRASAPSFFRRCGFYAFRNPTESHGRRKGRLQMDKPPDSLRAQFPASFELLQLDSFSFTRRFGRRSLLPSRLGGMAHSY